MSSHTLNTHPQPTPNTHTKSHTGPNSRDRLTPQAAGAESYFRDQLFSNSCSRTRGTSTLGPSRRRSSRAVRVHTVKQECIQGTYVVVGSSYNCPCSKWSWNWKCRRVRPSKKQSPRLPYGRNHSAIRGHTNRDQESHHQLSTQRRPLPDDQQCHCCMVPAGPEERPQASKNVIF